MNQHVRKKSTNRVLDRAKHAHIFTFSIFQRRFLAFFIIKVILHNLTFMEYNEVNEPQLL